MKCQIRQQQKVNANRILCKSFASHHIAKHQNCRNLQHNQANKCSSKLCKISQFVKLFVQLRAEEAYSKHETEFFMDKLKFARDILFIVDDKLYNFTTTIIDERYFSFT